MIRFGLCCKFNREPIRFRDCTAAWLAKMPRPEQLQVLAEIAAANVLALRQAITYCAGHGIGSFRINSRILPLITHPEVGYTIDALPGWDLMVAGFTDCGRMAQELGIRLTFHPDQFILLNSPRADVVAASLRELDYQSMVADWVGADVINIHGGGVYGDKNTALNGLHAALLRLPEPVKCRLTLENDDRSYTPADLLPICRAVGVPLVYDIHHHRCNPDGMSEADATTAALATWNREPLFHISSPRAGHVAKDRRPHHDFIDPADFPCDWLALDLTVEIEAKAKEDAIIKLKNDLGLC